jgi:hypothetical protein
MSWPSFRYGPNGESAVFKSASEVPAGWAEHPSGPFGAPVVQRTVLDVPVEAAADIPLTRAQIASALNERGIKFSKNTPTQHMYKKLLDSDPLQ